MVHSTISKKIKDLVQEGAVDPNEIQRSLREYIKTHFSEFSKPSVTDRAYYLTVNDICNYAHRAKIALQLSKLDQENLAFKMKEWSKSNSDDSLFFWPFLKKDCNSNIKDVAEVQFDQTVLWV